VSAYNLSTKTVEIQQLYARVAELKELLNMFEYDYDGMFIKRYPSSENYDSVMKKPDDGSRSVP
jgi:hypothetical protein